MKIIFGIALDGYEPLTPQHTIGEVTLGPAAFLELLETRLGLGGVWPAEVVRIIQYQQCLRAVDDGARFYSASFVVDAFAVAETTLGWRDQWVEAGWDRTAAETDSARVRDLAEVEVLARDQVSLGRADRLRAVVVALSARTPGIESVRLVDPVEALSLAWQQILAKLPVEFYSPDAWSAPTAAADTDLARLQQALLTNTKVAFVGDGSFFVAQAESETTLARALAEQWDTAGWANEPATIVTGGRGHLLDDGFRAIDRAITGAAAVSRWRPAAQVLSLALALLWKPMNPHRLLEFLTHPVCPVRQPLRGRLAKAVAEAPGIGGEAWNRAVDEARARVVEAAGGDRAASERIDEQLCTWLIFPRFDPTTGAPLTVVAEHCARVARWAGGRAAVEDLVDAQKAMFLAAQAQASAAVQALDTLRRSGVERILPLQLDRLIDEVTAHGATRGDLVPECGHVHKVTQAASVLEPVPRVLWWDFSPPTLPHKWPWTPNEIEQLLAHGVTLPSVDILLQQAASALRRPVMVARDQLVLAMPQRLDGEAATAHPLWDQIVALTAKGTLPALDVDQLLEQGRQDAWLALRFDPVAHRGLPRHRRWWRLDDPWRLSPRHEESFSSLNSFINAPHQWVLRYKAKLYPGALAKIEDNNRQKGTLAHRLIEWLFTDPDLDWRCIDQKALEQWIDTHYPVLLEEEGANLLLPGKARDAEELRLVVKSASWRLIEHLRHAGVEHVSIEQEGKGRFRGGHLGGYIDLLTRNKEGGEAVVDLKWSGFKYRCDELKENRQLQLAVYAVLRKQETGAWPSQAYFALSEARLGAQNSDYFGDATPCAPADPADTTPVLWAAFERTWQWRRDQLDQGLVEIVVEATEPDTDSVPPDEGLPVAEPKDKFDDYLVLTGWPEEA